MSQTPLESSAPAPKTAEDAFTANYWRLNRMIEEGKSWSGYERNCCFLNTGNGRFANISATSGFDFLDDARGLALTDWDHDGDLDLWITNRTAPRVRVMRNDTSSGHHFLAVHLQGSICNRDAIGARAELTIEGEDGGWKLIKTVRAGEGFLAQSSKWLHFGLGDASRGLQLTVRWPDGTTEQFTDLDVDARYGIVQGTGTAKVWTLPPRELKLASSQPTLPAVTRQVATALPVPLPLPLLEYASFDGEPGTLNGRRDKPLLVNLWASWCLPCARELAEFSRRSDELRAAGLDVLALSVDGLGENQSTTPQDAQKFLEKLNFPFVSGAATAGLWNKVQIVHDQLFAMRRPLPVPTGLLIDTQGRLVAIYKGQVEVERLLADVAQLSSDLDAWRAAAFPFEGLWHDFPEARLMPLVTNLFDRNYTNEAIQYALQNRSSLAGDSRFPSVLSDFGREMAQRGDRDAAVELFREALVANPDDSETHNNLGVQLGLQGQLDKAIEHLRRAVQLEPDNAEVHINLADALRFSGQLDESGKHVRRALEI